MTQINFIKAMIKNGNSCSFIDKNCFDICKGGCPLNPETCGVNGSLKRIKAINKYLNAEADK